MADTVIQNQVDYQAEVIAQAVCQVGGTDIPRQVAATTGIPRPAVVTGIHRQAAVTGILQVGYQEEVTDIQVRVVTVVLLEVAMGIPLLAVYPVAVLVTITPAKLATLPLTITTTLRHSKSAMLQLVEPLQ